MSKNTGKFATGALLAALIGYLAGILTAPKSGKETRQDIKETAIAGINEAERQLKGLYTELNKLLEEVSERADELTGKAKAELEEILEAGKSIKEKARDMLSALHEGESDDKDLRKAIAETTKAIDNLRKFIAKDSK